MRFRTVIRAFTRLVALACAAFLLIPASADAQLVDRLKRAAQNAAESELESQVDKLIRNAIRCAIDDPLCFEQASASGEDVIFVDDEGEIITDDDGTPITDRDEAMAAAPEPARPGEGVWANYDFVPGDEVLFYDDFSEDRVGDFPRRIDLVQGNWEVVDWAGGRYLRATANGMVGIVLPETLPERFTIEYPVYAGHGNAAIYLMPGRAYYGPARDYRGSVVTVNASRAGLSVIGDGAPRSMAGVEHRYGDDGPATLRIMADGDYMKVFLDEKRVANVPNSLFPRGDTLFLAISSASESSPSFVGPIRIAGGGRDLYDRLERDGRVATRGILFATNSDRIKPESTPTLEEIGTMLEEHPELRLSIEGHTDSDGDEAYNQDLSERRAAAVKAFLVDSYGIDASRLETTGFGESQPAADNATPEGKQQNRRVELVKLG